MKTQLPLVYCLFTAISLLCVVSPGSAEWLALGLMVCAGIPHGSFDLRVAEKKWRVSRSSKVLIVIAYLAGVLGMSGLCVFYPLVGLSLFLVISAAHFTEGELSLESPREILRSILLGVGAILLPIGLHLSQSRMYLSYFVPQQILEVLAPALTNAALATTVILAVMLGWDLRSARNGSRRETIERIVCLLGWIILPPLSGFAIWFIGRHSYHHLVVCRKKCSQTSGAIPRDFVLISILAIVGLLPFATFFDFSKIDQLFTASLCLIAGLTLPHMIVCHDVRNLPETPA